MAAEPTHCMRNNRKFEEIKSKELRYFPKVRGSFEGLKQGGNPVILMSPTQHMLRLFFMCLLAQGTKT